jgi:hypothetical protein
MTARPLGIALTLTAAVLTTTHTASAAPVVYLLSNNAAAETGPGSYSELIVDALGAGTTVNVVSDSDYADGINATREAELEAADLVIISRNSSSGNFDGPALGVFNGTLTTPVIANSPIALRNFRLNWFNIGSTATSTSELRDGSDDSLLTYYGVVEDLQFLDSNSAGNGTVDAYVDVVDDDDFGAGDYLANVSFAAGTEYYATGPTASGFRQLFTLDAYDSAADFDTDLTPAGRAALQNAIVTAIPEPASLAMLGFGGLCFVGRRRVGRSA